MRLRRNLAEMRGADFLLALGDQHQIDRQGDAGLFEGVQRGEERRLRPLLVRRTAPHDRAAESLLVDKSRLCRRRRPFAGIELLHIVHEIDAERARGADIVGGEDAGMSIRQDDFHLLKTRIARQRGHIFGALLHVEVLGGDRGIADPVLNARNRRILLGLGGCADRSAVVILCERRPRKQACGGQHAACQKRIAAIQFHHDFPPLFVQGRMICLRERPRQLTERGRFGQARSHGCPPVFSLFRTCRAGRRRPTRAEPAQPSVNRS
ncbi:hypothetical protein C725_2239 [Pacificimonas flava]|uniref:Uncharacterized protein n=1 Tax=Pacificimonas flava TaxID=1234595 RepID=M2U3J7_9SPHN|nr:hypothetical protein C725_2239 [Pacificimonas flava]